MPRFRSALIVDDDPERRAEMRQGLLDHGVRSDEAATVREAIGRLAVGSYQMVVCDMVLCDPPGAANPAVRGYLAVCFALSLPTVPTVVQASTHRRWRHRGALLTNWAVSEVADVAYGSRGIAGHESEDGGCLWSALAGLAAAAPEHRVEAVASLLRLPVLRELESLAGLRPAVIGLEDAAEGLADWDEAVTAARQAFFPGAGDG